jgi:hypothetical protein
VEAFLVSSASPASPSNTRRDAAVPDGLAFGGANMWVSNTCENTVTKLRASDGANLGVFAVGKSPIGVVFDGTSIWTTNWGDGTVTK